MTVLSLRQLLAYGALAAPLAMAALPVYVHAPKFYGDELGMNLAAIGGLLLLLRLVDAVQDPWLGNVSDRWAARPHGRLLMAVGAVPLLALGMVALFNPPAWADVTLWFAGSLFVVYLGYSAATISYQALGAELSTDPHQRTRITAAREGLALLGVLAAAAAPHALEGLGGLPGLAAFSILFVPVLLIAARITVGGTPAPERAAASGDGFMESVRGALANGGFRRLLAVYVVSGVAAAVPATLVLFFVDDVLGAEHLAGGFLVAYFLAGAAGMPLWVRIARAAGKRNAWLASMLLAVAAFVWAFFLGEGDVAAFFAICLLSGFALGADLALPPSLLADVIDDGRGRARDARAGSYFGLWSLATKMNLALAAGIALPLVAWFGYQPGADNGEQALVALAAGYALLPSALKLVAAALLALGPGRCAPLLRCSGGNA